MESYFSNSETAKRGIKRFLSKPVEQQWCDFESALSNIEADDTIEVDFLKQAIIGIMGTKMFADPNLVFRNNCISFAFQSLSKLKDKLPMSTILNIEIFIRMNLLSGEEHTLLDKAMVAPPASQVI